MRREHIQLQIVCCLTLLLLSGLCWGAEIEPGKPSKQDKCPVCGMFIFRYPDWVAEIVFKDGKTVFFDGPKDMFKYYLNLKKYDPSRKAEDIAGIYVSEYYGLKPIKAEDAFFMVGSDVFGPMGRELIPLSSEKEAETFKVDHKGKTILKFRDVNTDTIRALE